MAKPEVDLEQVLGELGGFGRYQVRTYALVMLPIIFSAAYNGQYIFNAGAVPYRCLVPECETADSPYAGGAWTLWALPEGGGGCARRAPLADNCTESAFHATDTLPCARWLYETQDTIVATFLLACQEWRRTLVGTVHSAGLFAALPLTGYVSDAFGRRTALVLTAVLAGAVGVLRSFANSYGLYLALEFMEATLGSGVYSTGFILALEMVGSQQRVLGGNIVSCCYALGQVGLALAAWALPSWRWLTRALYAPSLLFVVYVFLIEESVRWLLSKGKNKEAARIIFKAAEINNTKLSPATTKLLTENLSDLTVPAPTTESEGSLLRQVLRSRVILTRVCICSFWWMTVTFIYYGLSINSVSLAGNSYVNYILTCLVEIPGYALSILTLDRFGRKSSIITAFFVCGASLVVLPFLPENLQWLATSLTMLGKLCISMTFSSIYIYTSELFPTAARHSLLGFCSMVGRVGSIVAPQSPLLMRYMASLPYLLFGAMAAAAGLLMLLTPETLHRRLPDTVAEAEDIRRDAVVLPRVASPRPAPPRPASPRPASPRPSGSA